MFTKLQRRALEWMRDLLDFILTKVLLRMCPQLVNLIYNLLPHRWLVFLLGHGVLGKPALPFEWEVRLKNGKSLKVNVDPSDRFTVGLAFDYKIHDVGLKRAQELFLDRCGAKLLYLDIGANIGVSSIYALSVGRMCWLFEPNISLHSVGKTLFDHNGYTNARWESVALSDTTGETRFFVSRSSFLSSFDKDHAAREGDVTEVIVPLRTLDSYLAEIQAVTNELVIKIDVEGHEMKVLLGATQVFTVFRPLVMIELLHSQSCRREAWAYFKALDYVCYRIFDEEKLRVQLLQSFESLAATAEINFIFLPAQHRLRGELESHQ